MNNNGLIIYLRIGINFIFSCILINYVSAQDFNIKILDSFKIKSDQIYLDHLNQLYVIQSQDHLILKFDDQFQIKKESSSSFYAEPLFMSVVDPMKIILFIPSFSNVQILNSDLTLLSDEYYQEFNSESAITHYSNQSLCYFANGKITLKNTIDNRLLESENIYYNRSKELKLTEIKSNGKDIYLLIPGVGLWHFNEFLKLEHFINDSTIEHIDLYENKLFISKQEQIEILNLNLKSPLQKIKFSFPILSFSVNKNYLLLADKNKIFRYKIF
jgi:hypothetical protein